MSKYSFVWRKKVVVWLVYFFWIFVNIDIQGIKLVQVYVIVVYLISMVDIGLMLFKDQLLISIISGFGYIKVCIVGICQYVIFGCDSI